MSGCTLGFLFHSENTNMLEIMSDLMDKYVPTEKVKDASGHWSTCVLLRVSINNRSTDVLSIWFNNEIKVLGI